nr:hypothetical protein BN993_03785 [Virgibacillus halodenitrificans]
MASLLSQSRQQEILVRAGVLGLSAVATVDRTDRQGGMAVGSVAGAAIAGPLALDKR